MMGKLRPAASWMPAGALLLSVSLFTACPTKKVVTCGPNQAFNPELGECYDCPPGTKVNKATASCEPIECSPTQAYDPNTKQCYDCPEGTVLDFNTRTCVPDSTEDIQSEVTQPDVVDVVDETTDVPDTTPELDLNQPDEVSKDLVQSGEIGAACNMDSQCEGDWTCFDWPGGYCTQVDCQSDGDCPANTHCLPLLENAQACFQECSDMGECRDGYACKGLTSMDGITKYICHPLGPQQKQLGEPCTGPAACDGELGCVSLGPASMCTLTGCSSSDPCPEGSQCAIRGNMTLCLPECETTADCDPAFDGNVECQEIEDLDGKDRMLCGSANTGLALGEECFANEDCQSGYCHLLVIGQCSNNGELCGSDGDCPQGFCIGKQANQRGVCSAACGSGVPCPGGSLCVLTEEGPLCMLQCSDYGVSCGPNGLDMTCRFGLVYYPQVPSGKAACVKIKSGEPGTECAANQDCLDGGECFHPESQSGYCIKSCFSNQECPFGTACVSDEGMCRRVCKSDLDCPEVFSCRTHTASSENLCLLE